MLINKFNIKSNLFVFGLGHFAIDAVSALLIFSLLGYDFSSLNFLNLVILYNSLAFGLQFIFGFICDKLKIPKVFAYFGLILGLIAYFVITFTQNAMAAVMLVGIGNAIYHVGAGTISLNLTPKKATAPGIFVAPGAIGLLIGTLVGRSNPVFWPFVVLLFVCLIMIFLVKIPPINYNKTNTNFNLFELFIILILLTITVRSFVGTFINLAWKSDISLLILLTAGIFLGKSLGGIIADKFGFIKTGVISLFLSAILLSLFQNNPFLAITGMFLFNFTMPITLVALSNSLPGRPGFAFGLACLAILIGVLPKFYISSDFFNSFLLAGIILLSCLSIYIALKIK